MNENLLRYSKLFLKRNTSTILTCIGGIGVVVSSVLAAKATPKAIRLIEKAEKEKGDELTKLEIILNAGPAYIPAVAVGIATIACIFGANVLNKRQQAALMSAYALIDNSYNEYKNKVKELYGEQADQKIRAEVAKDRFEDEESYHKDDKQLFYDEYSNRYFRATNEAVLRAEYEINRVLAEDCYVTLNEYYDLLDIPKVDYGECVGWSSAQMLETHRISWINFYHEKVEMDDGLECYIISIAEPLVNFEDY